MNSSTSEFIDMNSFMHSYMNSAFVNIDSYSWNHRYEFICMNAYVNSSFAPWIHDYEFVYFLIHSYEFILWFNDMKSAVNSTYKHWIHHHIPNSYMNAWLMLLKSDMCLQFRCELSWCISWLPCLLLKYCRRSLCHSLANKKKLARKQQCIEMQLKCSLLFYSLQSEPHGYCNHTVLDRRGRHLRWPHHWTSGRH